jgi:DNA helicase TIP49 (TBP-interacting protein)
MEAVRRALGVRIREMRKVYEGVVKEETLVIITLVNH